jgi:hypothetical protein
MISSHIFIINESIDESTIQHFRDVGMHLKALSEKEVLQKQEDKVNNARTMLVFIYFTT